MDHTFLDKYRLAIRPEIQRKINEIVAHHALRIGAIDPTVNGVELERENDIPENLKEYLLDSGLDGIEVHRTKDACHYR